MLKALFSSKARIKLLQTFLLHPEEEFYVRELTRMLEEQINGIRRELDSLKKIGLLKSKSKDRKKHYYLNTNFPIYPELRSIFLKTISEKRDIVGTISSLGSIDFLLLSGAFIKKDDAPVDMLIVGDINRDTLSEIVENFSTEAQIRYSLMSTENFLYRVEFKDSFIFSLLKDPENKIVINKVKKFLKNS